MTEFDGLVLTGGSARRLGGVDKPSLVVGDRSMVGRAVDALRDARRVIVIGPGGDVIEDPPGGGPVAAIAAGLALVRAPVVAILAADLPFVTSPTVDVLVASAPAVAVDDRGREQYLLAAYPTEVLRSALPVVPHGARLSDVVAALRPHRVQLSGFPPPWWDCDTDQELEQARAWA
ncbi:MAG: molybdenum cofactor guanylyltransferase [Actinomycetes bacterium]